MLRAYYSAVPTDGGFLDVVTSEPGQLSLTRSLNHGKEPAAIKENRKPQGGMRFASQGLCLKA